MILGDTLQAVKLAWDASDIDEQLWLSAAPAAAVYPFVTCRVIDSPRTRSIKDGSGVNHHYASIRMQFDAWGNQDQLTECMALAGEIEELFDDTPLSMGTAGTTAICARVVDQRAGYYDSGNKTWNVSTDVIFMMGD